MNHFLNFSYLNESSKEQTINQELEIIDYSNDLEKMCKNNKDCGNCRTYLPNEEIKRSMDDFDEYGCVNANYLVRMTEDYQQKTNNEKIDKALIALTCFSKGEGILTHNETLKKGIPNKVGILTCLKELRALLGRETTEQNVLDIEPATPLFSNAIRISRKIQALDLI